MSSDVSAISGETQKRSSVEVEKESSRQLRGTIALTLVSDADHFSDSDKNLLKFHGSYQQMDRDARKARKKEGSGSGKAYMFMVRCKIPGGRVTAEQYLAVDRLTSEHANGTLRITSRQGIQFHGVLWGDLKPTIKGINDCLLSTLGACGDVERNVMAPPAPLANPVYRELQQTAARLAAHLAPRTRAYHEIWLDGERVDDNEEDLIEEPMYGKAYLPRKFKTGLGLPEDNSVDIYAQDLGLLALVENGRVVGYNALVGGGMGMSHGNDTTFPYVARPICYVPVTEVVTAVEAVIKLFRDYGNRADRKHARIKYLVHGWGVERFRQVLQDYLPFPLQLPRPIEVTGFPLHLGWNAQGDGKFWYGVSVENGRIKDQGSLRMRTCFRTLVERLRPAVRLTPMQDILFCDLPESARPEIEALLDQHGVSRPDQLSEVRRHSIACPAVPTCALAISESERVLPGILDELERELDKLGLSEEKISVRMTGCPNGCARPYQSDIGIVGRSGDKYTLFLGGHVLGHRLNVEFKDLVPREQLVPVLATVLRQFKDERQVGETFGDFCQRVGMERLTGLVAASA